MFLRSNRNEIIHIAEIKCRFGWKSEETRLTILYASIDEFTKFQNVFYRLDAVAVI